MPAHDQNSEPQQTKINSKGKCMRVKKLLTGEFREFVNKSGE
jgi:hypothetical protein